MPFIKKRKKKQFCWLLQIFFIQTYPAINSNLFSFGLFRLDEKCKAVLRICLCFVFLSSKNSFSFFSRSLLVFHSECVREPMITSFAKTVRGNNCSSQYLTTLMDMQVRRKERNLGSISSTFYLQLLRTQIPKA